MFVLMLAELGLVGGIWITAFLLSIARYGAPFGLLVVIMFSVSALFTHNHFEWPAVGMLFALYLVVAKRYEKKRLLNGVEAPGSSRTFGPVSMSAICDGGFKRCSKAGLPLNRSDSFVQILQMYSLGSDP